MDNTTDFELFLKLIKDLSELMLKHYFGDRCPDYEESCEICRRWEALDKLTYKYSTTRECFSSKNHLTSVDDDGYCIYCGTQDSQVYLFSFHYCDCDGVYDVSMFLKNKFVQDTELALYQDISGGLFAIDSSYISEDAGPARLCFNPFTGEEFEPE